MQLGAVPNICAGCLPKRYAPMSLMMTNEHGSRNHISPSKILLTKKLEGMKTTSRIMWVQAYCPNWYMYMRFCNLSTNVTKPAQEYQCIKQDCMQAFDKAICTKIQSALLQQTVCLHARTQYSTLACAANQEQHFGVCIFLQNRCHDAAHLQCIGNMLVKNAAA